MSVARKYFNDFLEVYYSGLLWLRQRKQRLIGAALGIVVAELSVLFFGLYLKQQVVLGLGTIALALFGLCFYLRVLAFSTVAEEFLRVLHAMFSFIPEVLTSEQWKNLRKGFLSGLAWLTIMHILFATIFVKWTEGGTILVFLSIRLFAAIAVQAWDIKTDKYRKVALSYGLIVACLIVLGALFPGVTVGKVMRGLYSKDSAAVRYYREHTKISGPAPERTVIGSLPEQKPLPLPSAALLPNVEKSNALSAQPRILSPVLPAQGNQGHGDDAEALERWLREANEQYPDIQ